MGLPRFALLPVVAFTLLAACEPTESSTPVPAPPAELQGEWLDRWSTSFGYSLAVDAYDFRTGVWFGGRPDLWDLAPARGLGLAIHPDGTFLWVLSADGGLGGCQSYSVQVIRGTVTAQEGILHFHPTAQRQRYASTCDPSLNYDRTLANEDFELGYVVSGPTVETSLHTLRLLDQAAGIDVTFYLDER